MPFRMTIPIGSFLAAIFLYLQMTVGAAAALPDVITVAAPEENAQLARTFSSELEQELEVDVRLTIRPLDELLERLSMGVRFDIVLIEPAVLERLMSDPRNRELLRNSQIELLAPDARQIIHILAAKDKEATRWDGIASDSSRISIGTPAVSIHAKRALKEGEGLQCDCGQCQCYANRQAVSRVYHGDIEVLFAITDQAALSEIPQELGGNTKLREFEPLGLGDHPGMDEDQLQIRAYEIIEQMNQDSESLYLPAQIPAASYSSSSAVNTASVVVFHALNKNSFNGDAAARREMIDRLHNFLIYQDSRSFPEEYKGRILRFAQEFYKRRPELRYPEEMIAALQKGAQ